MKTSTRCVGSWDRRESLEIEEMVMTQNGDSIAECEPQLVPDFRAYWQLFWGCLALGFRNCHGRMW